MQTFDVPVRYLPPGPEELSPVMGGSRSWHRGREAEPPPADASDQTKPEIPRIRHADLQIWIDRRIKEIKRVPLADRIAASLEK